MKLAIMQPYFFPYLGHFDLINCVDKWIVFDTAQYIRHGWVNRNRILHPQKGWQYFIAPLKKHSLSTKIKDIEVQDGDQWKKRIIGQLQHYKKSAWRHFKDTCTLVQDCLDTEETSITKINIHIMQKTCEKLGIPFNYNVFSEMDLQIGPIEKPGDWALRISEALGADEYINPPGGEDIFDKEAFAKIGIKLTLRKIPHFTYECQKYDFIPNLSIIDVMFWNSPSQIKQFLDIQKKKCDFNSR